MDSGVYKAREYLVISLLGQVPAMNDDGVRLSDSNAIPICYGPSSATKSPLRQAAA